MSVPSYLFHSLPLKLINKGGDFPFPSLKVSNKGRERYYKIIIFIHFHFIPFPPPKWGLGYARPVANVSNLVIFPNSTSNAYLNAFPNSDWADLSVPRKVWMSSFQNTEKMKFQ